MLLFVEYSGAKWGDLALWQAGRLARWSALAALAAWIGTGSLRAADPPNITQGPTKATRFEGENQTFTVVATGTAPLSYQWQKGGSNLTGQTNSSLVLLNLKLSDAGLYAAVVTNIAGAVTSAPAQLTVRGINDPRYPTPHCLRR